MKSRTVTGHSMAPAGVARRTVLGAAAWSVPAISLVATAPASAASDANQVSLSVPNNQVAASGVTPVVVTVRDHLGSPLAGQVVSLLGPDGSVLAPATGTTNGSGQFSTTLDLAAPWATPGKTVTLTALSGGTAASETVSVLGANLLVTASGGVLSQAARVFPSPVVDYQPLWQIAVLRMGRYGRTAPIGRSCRRSPMPHGCRALRAALTPYTS